MDESPQIGLRELLGLIIEGAKHEAPQCVFVPPRSWWLLRRGPRWRYPLPERRTFESRKRLEFWERQRVFEPKPKREKRFA